MHNIIIMIRDLASPIVLRSFLCPACVLHELWRLGLKDYLWPCKTIFHLLLDIHYFYLWYILFSIQLQMVVEKHTHKHTHARNNIRHINGNNGYLKWCLQNILTREVTRQHTLGLMVTYVLLIWNHIMLLFVAKIPTHPLSFCWH